MGLVSCVLCLPRFPPERQPIASRQILVPPTLRLESPLCGSYKHAPALSAPFSRSPSDSRHRLIHFLARVVQLLRHTGYESFRTHNTKPVQQHRITQSNRHMGETLSRMYCNCLHIKCARNRNRSFSSAPRSETPFHCPGHHTIQHGLFSGIPPRCKESGSAHTLELQPLPTWRAN